MTNNGIVWYSPELDIFIIETISIRYNSSLLGMPGITHNFAASETDYDLSEEQFAASAWYYIGPL